MRSWLVQVLVFWSLVHVLPAPTVTRAAWWALYGLAALAAWWAGRWRRTAAWPARAWAVLAMYAVLGAMFFAGANQGLDALYGAHRHKAQVSAQLGGLELWCVLCPGLFSLALGRFAGRWP